MKLGLSPIAREIDLERQSVFQVSSFLGRSIQYRFTGGEPTGLYLVFVLLVNSGADPTNTMNWICAEMVPLVFQP